MSKKERPKKTKIAQQQYISATPTKNNLNKQHKQQTIHGNDMRNQRTTTHNKQTHKQTTANADNKHTTPLTTTTNA